MAVPLRMAVVMPRPQGRWLQLRVLDTVDDCRPALLATRAAHQHECLCPDDGSFVVYHARAVEFPEGRAAAAAPLVLFGGTLAQLRPAEGDEVCPESDDEAGGSGSGGREVGGPRWHMRFDGETAVCEAEAVAALVAALFPGVTPTSETVVVLGTGTATRQAAPPPAPARATGAALPAEEEAAVATLVAASAAGSIAAGSHDRGGDGGWIETRRKRAPCRGGGDEAVEGVESSTSHG